MILNEGPGINSIMNLIQLAKDGFNAMHDSEDNKQKSQRRSNGKEMYSYSSSAKAASNLIAVFPIACSTNVKTDTASMITKYIEGKGLITLQLVLTAFNMTDVEHGIDYLRKYHQNLNGGGTIDDYEILMSRYLDQHIKTESVDLTTSQTEELVKALKETYTQFYESDINPIRLNDFVVSESVDGYSVEIDYYKYNISMEAAQEAPKKDEQSANKRPKQNLPELKDGDVRKMNESVPSLMVARFTNKDTKIITEFLIGVKAKLIPVDYMEILSKIYTKNRDGRGLVTLIRLTSGEINWAKDWLLAIDKNRNDILSMGKKGSKEQMWKMLEDRAEKSKHLLRQNKVNYASAITTVVITSEDADLLYKEENIDIRNPVEAKKFMQSYNLMGFIIVNESEEVAWIMFDENEPYFEKIAYTMLERETSDGQYKKIVNLMAKMK